MSVLCHFENAYFSLSPIDSGLKNKGTNTCRVYGIITTFTSREIVTTQTQQDHRKSNVRSFHHVNYLDHRFKNT